MPRKTRNKFQVGQYVIPEPIRPVRTGGFLTRKRNDPTGPYPGMLKITKSHQVDGTSPNLPTQLPVLHNRTGDPEPLSTEPTRRRLISFLPKIGRASRREIWRYRWHLAPVGASGLVTVGAVTVPSTTAVVLLGLSAGGQLAAQHAPEQIAGRSWLSSRERSLAGYWAAGAGAWTLGINAGWWYPSGAGLLAFAILTGAPAARWLHARRIRESAPKVPVLSEQARALIAAWPLTIGLNGPQPLLNSRVVASTMTEPASGAFAFAVELAAGVHAEHATGDELRRYLERVLRLPVKTVALTVDRDDSAQVRVTMTPARHLEGKPVAWQGPTLNEDGTIDLADAPDGSVIRPALHNEDGVEHFAVFGTSGVGKSNTVVALLLPGVMSGREVVIYLDGGRGTSASHLAGACDWWATEPAQWSAAIGSVHAVMLARKDRRAKQGISRWRGASEADPIITLQVDEATTVLRSLGRAEAEQVLEMLREGRKLGVRVGQATQDPMGDDLIGGRKARGLMGGTGSLIAHRPGDGTANTLTSSSSAAQIDLRALPGEPGWCGIIRRGQVLSGACKVRKATEEQVHSLLDGFTPRSLDGADLDAAGDSYTRRLRGVDAARRMVDEAAGRPFVEAHPGASTDTNDPTDDATVGTLVHPHFERMLNSHARLKQAEGKTNRLAVEATLRTNADMTVPQISAATGLSKSTVKRALRVLSDNGQVTRTETGWVTGVIDDRHDSTAA